MDKFGITRVFKFFGKKICCFLYFSQKYSDGSCFRSMFFFQTPLQRNNRPERGSEPSIGSTFTCRAGCSKNWISSKFIFSSFLNLLKIKETCWKYFCTFYSFSSPCCFLFFEKQENTLQFMSKQWNQSYLQVVALQKICTLLKLKKKIKGT